MKIEVAETIGKIVGRVVVALTIALYFVWKFSTVEPPYRVVGPPADVTHLTPWLQEVENRPEVTK